MCVRVCKRERERKRERGLIERHKNRYRENSKGYGRERKIGRERENTELENELKSKKT